tara:strand:- start:38 stop:181 length:144 start_codon:yes stop_codon:yes gene_type:complete
MSDRPKVEHNFRKMKAGRLHRYWSKFKARKKHYDAGLYQLKKGDEEE